MLLTPTEYRHARATAELVLAERGFAGRERPCPLEVCDSHDIPVHFVEPRFLVGRVTDGIFNRQTNSYDIYCRAGPLDPVKRFRIAHELGHYIWRVRAFAASMSAASVEAWCNAFAGALLIRSELLRLAWRAFGTVQAILRRWAHVPQTAVAMRIGEEELAAVWITQRDGIRHDRDLIASGRRSSDVLALGERAVSRGSARFSGFYGKRLDDGIRRATVLYTP